MATFELACTIGVSAFTTVEADTLEQAIEIAKTRLVVLGGGGGEDPEEEWVIDAADGEPDGIHVA